MAEELKFYPIGLRSRLGHWEWYILLYWNSIYAHCNVEKVEHLRRLAQEFSQDSSIFHPEWLPLSGNELKRWRWRFLWAKLGLRAPFAYLAASGRALTREWSADEILSGPWNAL